MGFRCVRLGWWACLHSILSVDVSPVRACFQAQAASSSAAGMTLHADSGTFSQGEAAQILVYV